MKFPYFLGAALLGLTACQKDDPTARTEAALNQRLTLRYGQSVVLPNKSAPELTFWFQEVGGDSRCPREATCVWAGEIKVTLAVADQSSTSQPLTLRLFGLTSTADSATVQANGRQYTVVLHEVNPYPSLKTVPKEDLKATLTIRRR